MGKPANYLNWCADNAPTHVAEPPQSLKQTGYGAGEKPAYQHFNWLLNYFDQFTQYLDQAQNNAGPSALVQQDARVLGGGNWSWNLSTSTLAWSNSFVIAIVSEADSNNTVAAGSVSLADGQVAYVNANIPFSTTGNTATGSNQLTALAYQLGIVVGQGISGQGIPAGTTVQAISGQVVTMSQNATASATGVAVTFASTGALVMQTAQSSTFVPKPQTFVLARRNENRIILGLFGEYVLRDMEQKTLRGTGYVEILTALAGVALTSGQPVYVSPGGALDANRNQGQLYPCESSGATGAIRGNIVGVVMTSMAAGAQAQAIGCGWAPLYTGLTPGLPYYVDPSNPGALTTTRPSAAGQYVISPGVAVSSNILMVNPSGSVPMAIGTGFARGNAGVQNEAQLATALAQCQAAGGGIIMLQGSFTISAGYTIPSYTTILGARGQSVITVVAGGGIAIGSYATLQDTHFVTSVSNGGYIVSMSGQASIMRQCRFALPQNLSIICLNVTGSSNRTYNCKFDNVSGSPSAVGIKYAGGSDNIDNSSVFT